MTRRFSFPGLFLLVLLALVACSTPTETPEPTATPVPAVPSATSTPLPPTATPTPTPIPIPLELEVDRSIPLDRFSPGGSFSLTFNQPMDADSVTVPLLFSPFLEGDIVWDETRTELAFIPLEHFSPGTDYLVVLDEDLASADGQHFDELLQWDLAVLPAPKVTGRTPEFRTLTERRPSIQLTFSQEMDQESVAAALAVEPKISYAMEWEGETVAIVPEEPLAPGETYQFNLGAAAANNDGIALTDEIRWTYRVSSLVAYTTGPDARLRDAPVVIHFNYAMDTESVRDALVIEPSVAGDLTWNEEGTVATFSPAARLPSGTEYTVSFGGPLLDANGEACPLPEPHRFITPPPILRALPADEGYVHPANAIEVTFDRPMDEEKMVAAIEINPETAGTYSWRETTLFFWPEDDHLAENTPYTVTISTAAVAADGEGILDEPYSWSFLTGQLQDVATFGMGPNAQVLDVDGRRAVQFQIYQESAAAVSFELYDLTLEQFLDRYASGFRGVAGSENRPISTQGTQLVTEWQIETTPAERNWANIQEVLIPDDVPPGLYILNLKLGHVNDQLILLLSENTLVVKQAEGQLVTWATDINGAPLAGIEVSVYARDGELITRGPSDENGVYRARIERDPQPLIVVARDGADITASGLSDEWRSGGSWWGWWNPPPTALDHAVYVYTDRPIYRPGQTVYYKAIIRGDDDAILDLVPAGTPVTVRIRDGRDNVVQTVELTTNHFGTVNGEFQLAEGAMLGEYAVEIVPGAGGYRQPFKVEDYRKPDYQVSVTTDRDWYVAGDEIAVTVDSSYFFGEPVPNADLVINRYALGDRYWWMDGGDDDYIWYESYSEPVTARTDDNGRFTLTLGAGMSNYVRSVNWRGSLEQSVLAIEATVDDGSHQTVSGFKVYRVYSAVEQLTLDTGGYAKEPGEPFTLLARATTVDGDPVSGRVLRLQLLRYNRDTYGYDSVIQSMRLTTEADGEVRIPVTIEEPGYYRLKLTGADRQGNEISTISWIYAFSDRYTAWYGRDGDISIDADRDSYTPGDTARLLVSSSFSGPALLTFERGTTRREELVELTAPLTLLDVPIQVDDAPNIFVTVNAWDERDTTLTENVWESIADSSLHTASVELIVPVTGKTLNVTITPDKTGYSPREEAQITIRVTNERGEPVSTEVSLAMVDEAIFALSEELSGPIFDAFYSPRENIVRTYHSMAPTRYLGGGRGGGGGGDLAGNPRSDFPDTAEWFPVLQTDANGEVVVTFALPDSLTSWRLTAKAATADTQVGETVMNIVTKQDVVVRPILPRSLTAGDRVELSAIVHNYSDSRQELAVSLAISHLDAEFSASPTQTISLAPGDLRVVGWPVTVADAGEAEILIRADVDGEAMDAVLLTMPVRPLAVPDVESQVGQFSGEMATTLLVPEGALGISTVRIELSRSIAGSLLEGLEYLTGFPYGCVEQTMSRALPNAVVGRAFHQLGVSNPTLMADLPAKVSAGLQRLYGYQHNDGGWGWWYDDSTHDYQTAWVVFGLAVTAEAGYEVDPGVIERGAVWLRDHLGEMDIRTQAFALYSLATAGHGELDAALSLLDHLDELDTFSQAALALAFHELNAAAEAGEILDNLVETAVVGDGRVFWDSDDYDGYYYQKTMASTTRSTALALSAFTRIRPNHALEPDIVRWLMGQRRQQGWGTTNETSFAILGLTDHLLAAQDATAETTYSVVLNGDLIAGGALGPEEPAVSLEIPVGEMETGLNSLHIQQSDGGRLYYLINSRIYLAQEEIEPAGVIEVSRDYLDLRTDRPITTVVPGDLVRVRLVVDMPDNGSYIIVEDQLPGGLEALNERLNTTSHVATVEDWIEPRYYWQEYGYNQKEVHGDRVSFFITDLSSGQHIYTYLARATHQGEFVALPVEVSAMYDLATWGRSASGRLVVAPPESDVQARGPGSHGF